MLGIDRKAARFTWTAALIAVLIGCVYLVRKPLIVFAVALLLTYLLYPLYTLLARILPGRSRAPALALVYVTFFGMVTLIVITIGSKVVDEANSLATYVKGEINKPVQEAPVTTPPLPKRVQDQILDQV